MREKPNIGPKATPRKPKQYQPSEAATRLADGIIDAELQAWLAKPIEERRAIIAERQRQEAEKEANRDRISTEQLAETLGAFAQLAKGVRPMSLDEERAFRWRKYIAPRMAYIGLDERHRKEITDWQCPQQEEKFLRVRELCCGTGAIVALCGPRGTGKTTIAAQLMRERVVANHYWDHFPERREGRPPADPGRYAKLLRLGGEFKLLFAGFGGINQDAVQERYNSWTRLELVVIDELHDAEANAPAMALLVDLCDRRYAARLDTILISNRSAEEFAEAVNPSIESRISENGRILKCDWPSWRARLSL